MHAEAERLIRTLGLKPHPEGGYYCETYRSDIEVATSEGLAGDDLDALEKAVIDRYRADAEAEAKARKRADELHALAIRGIYRTVRDASGGSGAAPGEEEEALG